MSAVSPKHDTNLILLLEQCNCQHIVDTILSDLPLSDILALRLSHPGLEPIVYRQYLNNKLRYDHYISSLSLRSRIKYRTYAFYEPSIPITETIMRLETSPATRKQAASPSISDEGCCSEYECGDASTCCGSVTNDTLDRDSGIIEIGHTQTNKAEKARELDSRSIFVGNIQYSLTESDITRHFTRCGKVKRVTMIYDRNSGIFRGFCYIEFDKSTSVDLAMQMQGLSLRNRELRIRAKRTNAPGLGRQALVVES